MKTRAFLTTFLTCMLGFNGLINRAWADGLQQESVISRTAIADFVDSFPKFKTFKSELERLYSSRTSYIWFDKNGLSELASVLEKKLDNLNEEGIFEPIPYPDKIHAVLQKPKLCVENELLLSCASFFAFEKTYEGLPESASISTGWQLPRDKKDSASLIETAFASLKSEEEPRLFPQYYLLKSALAAYLEMEIAGAWQPIEGLGETVCPGDSSALVGKVRRRLYAQRFLKTDSGSNSFDNALKASVYRYRECAGLEVSEAIDANLVASLNIPIRKRIRTLAVNMERCRWLPSLGHETIDYVAVNIPSFKLIYVANGKKVLESEVIVGKESTRTVVFSGTMSSIVFSPYWNVPNSIAQKEILPIAKRNPGFLGRNHLEWHAGKLRQRPGPDNPLGCVKFMFPNANTIYLHDTPSVDLFEKHRRAFSHGCIRVRKAKELAKAMLLEDGGWPVQKVDEAMCKTQPETYKLKTPVPVYIVYFTSWVDPDGTVHFYDDIYHRDEKVADLLFCE